MGEVRRSGIQLAFAVELYSKDAGHLEAYISCISCYKMNGVFGQETKEE